MRERGRGVFVPSADHPQVSLARAEFQFSCMRKRNTGSSRIFTVDVGDILGVHAFLVVSGCS